MKKYKTINVNININLLKKIDKVVKKKNMSRSAFLAESARQLLLKTVEERSTGRLRWLVKKPKFDEFGRIMVANPRILQQEVIIQKIHEKDSECISKWVNIPIVKELNE